MKAATQPSKSGIVVAPVKTAIINQNSDHMLIATIYHGPDPIRLDACSVLLADVEKLAASTPDFAVNTVYPELRHKLAQLPTADALLCKTATRMGRDA